MTQRAAASTSSAGARCDTTIAGPSASRSRGRTAACQWTRAPSSRARVSARRCSGAAHGRELAARIDGRRRRSRARRARRAPARRRPTRGPDRRAGRPGRGTPARSANDANPGWNVSSTRRTAGRSGGQLVGQAHHNLARRQRAQPVDAAHVVAGLVLAQAEDALGRQPRAPRAARSRARRRRGGDRRPRRSPRRQHRQPRRSRRMRGEWQSPSTSWSQTSSGSASCVPRSGRAHVALEDDLSARVARPAPRSGWSASAARRARSRRGGSPRGCAAPRSAAPRSRASPSTALPGTKRRDSDARLQGSRPRPAGASRAPRRGARTARTGPRATGSPSRSTPTSTTATAPVHAIELPDAVSTSTASTHEGPSAQPRRPEARLDAARDEPQAVASQSGASACARASSRLGAVQRRRRELPRERRGQDQRGDPERPAAASDARRVPRLTAPARRGPSARSRSRTSAGGDPEPVAQHVGRHLEQVLDGDELAPREHGVRLRRAHPRQRGARAHRAARIGASRAARSRSPPPRASRSGRRG